MPSPTYELADITVGGTLAQKLEEMRSEGVTYDRMVERLRPLGVDVSRETLRRWVKDLAAVESVDAETAA